MTQRRAVARSRDRVHADKPGVACYESLGLFPGSVGRAVLHQQHLGHRLGNLPRQVVEEPGQSLANGGLLVMHRDDDRALHAATRRAVSMPERMDSSMLV